MRLTKLVIQGFKSIESKQELHIDETVSVLIGPNDHGKTNILQAIKSLNDDSPFTEQDKNWDSYDTSLPRIEYHFQLENEDIEGFTKVCAAISVATPTGTETVSMGFQKFESIIFIKEGIGAKLKLISPEYILKFVEVVDYFLKARPRVELFHTNVTVLKDTATLAQLNTPEFEFMQGIFRKAGIWEMRESLFSQNPKTTKQLADASARLTQKIRDEWEQGINLTFYLVSINSTIQLQIKDPAVKEQYVLPSQKSSGFSAFFSLDFILYARSEAIKSRRHIYLFDEPGTYLHPLGQVNLQRVFESIGKKNQVVYSTHSIFMINKNKPTCNTVVFKDETGTQINHKPYINNWKSVKANLGLFFCNNFFFANTTLLVEGPSDVIYVLAMLRKFSTLGKLDVDVNLFSIQDAGNTTDYVSMAKIMVDEGRKVVALLDGDSAGLKTKERVEKLNNGLPEDQKIVCILLPTNKSTEDMLPYRQILQKSIIDASNELTTKAIREFVKFDLNVEERIKTTFAANSKDTLGKRINDATKEFFKDKEEPLSKLLIARTYNSLIEDESAYPSDGIEGLELCEKLKKELGLKSKEAPHELLQKEAN